MDNSFVLAQNGRSNACIVTDTTSGALGHFAARELQHFISACTGARLPIAGDVPTGRKGIILAVSPATFDDGANGEALRVNIREDAVYITGSGERGLLYGAYAFLERCLGVRFLTAEKSVTPHADEVLLQIGRFEDKPALRYRIEPYKCVRDPRIQARLRINMGQSDFSGASAPLAGIGRAYPFSYGHSIGQIVPDALFTKHPEYFPLINGKREAGPGHQRCLTNPEVKKLAIDWVTERLRQNPGQKLIAVGQNDTDAYNPFNCQCPACRALDEREGTPMGSLLSFVNDVAEAIEPEFPDVTVTTLAYRYTRRAPKTIRPRHNVAIILCSIECCFSHPLEARCGADYQDGANGTIGNEAFISDLEQWSAISDRLIIWDYIVNFAHYLAPHPNFDVLAQNMRFFAAHKACGIYPEGVHDVLGADMEDLRAYVVSRLMWNPNLDAWTEAEEFLNGLIGAAAQPVLRAMKRLHAHVKQDHIHLSTYRRPDEVMFPRDLLDAMRADLDEAAALAGDARPAVEKMIMSLRYVELIVYGGTKPADEKRALMQTFLNDMQAFGITGIHEGGAGAEAAAKRLEQLLSDC